MHRTSHTIATLLCLLSVCCSRSTTRSKANAETHAPNKDTQIALKKGEREVLQNKGSDTLVNVAQAWAEEYKNVNSSMAIAVIGGGSGSGISALLNGTADLANSSRAIKPTELALAKQKDIVPVEHTVGYDALSVLIHKDNPLSEISLEQLAGIYGEGGKLEKWSQLNVKVPGCNSDEIIRVSRQKSSGTYAYFKSTILGKGKYKLGSRRVDSSRDAVALVAKTPCAIGYSGLAYATPEVKSPCIKKDEDSACVAPSIATAEDRSYPIARPLYMYTNGEAQGSVKDYLDWIKSKEGQCTVQKNGYAPAAKVDCD